MEREDTYMFWIPEAAVIIDKMSDRSEVDIPQDLVYGDRARAVLQADDGQDPYQLLQTLANQFPAPSNADRVELIQASAKLANDLFDKMESADPNVRNTAKILYHLVKGMIDVLDQIVKDDVLLVASGTILLCGLSCVVGLGSWFCITVGTSSGAAVAWRALKITAMISGGFTGLHGLSVAVRNMLLHAVDPLRFLARIPRPIEEAKED